MSDKLYLVNYRCAGVQPMRSITRLERGEAMRVAERLYETSACYAHRRFGPDFPDYFDYRLNAERWLHESFKTLGGKPETEHPLYFALVHSGALKRSFENGDELRIALDDIDEAHVSFTYGDSVAMFGSPKRRPVLTARELYADITRAGGVAALLLSVEEDYRCIEAQLWSDAYVAAYSDDAKSCNNIERSCV